MSATDRDNLNSWSTTQKHLSFPAHGRAVVTCLIYSHGRIISASDNHTIHVYSPITGTLERSLDGHEGGIWALATTKNHVISGSTDKTVRIWDLTTGKCRHTFEGHTSTVRCISLVKPEWTDIKGDDGVTRREKWPKRSLIISGSRDHTIRVWLLPKSDEGEYRRSVGSDDDSEVDSEEDEKNPFHVLRLQGHEHAVRAVAARGRTAVSGSYDCTLRVWDLVTGECKWVLTGHIQKVYSVVLDTGRNIACSGSMDGNVRVWDISTGECRHTLTGHTSLVGLLGLSPSYLVSASADSTLMVWDPDTGNLKQTLRGHTGAVTCFQHDEYKVVSGADGALLVWDIRDGTIFRKLLTDAVGVWQVVFKGGLCVAASNRADETVIDVWHFGVGEVENEKNLELEDDSDEEE